MATTDPHQLHPWRRMTFAQWAVVVVFLGLVLPFLVLFGGVVLLAAWDAIGRHL